MKKSFILLLALILSFFGLTFAQETVKESDTVVVTALKKDTETKIIEH